MKEQQHIFTNKMLRTLLIPVIFEQVLNSLMGTVDTMMVSNVGSAAISAVSLVDSINVLVIQAFSALAAGGGEASAGAASGDPHPSGQRQKSAVCE